MCMLFIMNNLSRAIKFNGFTVCAVSREGAAEVAGIEGVSFRSTVSRCEIAAVVLLGSEGWLGDG